MSAVESRSLGHLKPGDVLAGKYRVEALLGEGAMGTVVSATHVELGKRVAIKFMKAEALTGSESVERFMREARAAGRLQSEHACQVHDVGRLDSGVPYIVMELLNGEDMQTMLERVGPLQVGELARYIVDICDAIAEAHAIGIVHRDLKPQNLFRIRKLNGTVMIKVLDFGVSKFREEGAKLAETAVNSIIGTPSYMSPEQLSSSKNVDARSDIWALGVIMYQLLLGRLPFDGSDLLQLAVAIVNEQPIAPSQIRTLDPRLEAIILRCLEKDRERRFRTVGELSEALAPFAAPVVQWTTTGASTPGLTYEVPPTLHTFGSGNTPRPQVGASHGTSTLGAAASQIERDEPRSRRRGVWIGMSALVAVVGIIIAIAATRGGDGDGQRTAQPAAAAPIAAPPPSAPPPTAPPAVAATPSSAAPATTTTPATTPAATTTTPAATTTPTPTTIPTTTTTAASQPPATPTTARKHGGAKPPDKKKVSCDPPYTLDANGKRTYKPECL